MTLKEAISLEKYGETLDVKVTPEFKDGVYAVNIRDSQFLSFKNALDYLNYLKWEIQRGMSQIEELPWGAWLFRDTCGNHPAY